MKKFILLTLLLPSLLFSYEEGYGWDVPNTPINIGGYADMSFDNKRDEKFLFDDIALLVSADVGHFSFLGEVEYSHISLDGKSYGGTDIDMFLERLELSYEFNNEQSIKIGRFNSDVGYWNQAPIQILQDTRIRPHAVSHFFPVATTGIQYEQKINENHAFSLTFQDNADLAHQDYLVETVQHKAMAYHGINSKDDALSWRLSVGEYVKDDNYKARYAGIGAEYDGEDFDVQTELFTKDSPSSNIRAYSGYVQSTWHMKEKHDVVARFENYKDELNRQENIYLLGYVYRPTNKVSVKGEYVEHSKLPLNSFIYSLSVLF